MTQCIVKCKKKKIYLLSLQERSTSRVSKFMESESEEVPSSPAPCLQQQRYEHQKHHQYQQCLPTLLSSSMSRSWPSTATWMTSPTLEERWTRTAKHARCLRTTVSCGRETSKHPGNQSFQVALPAPHRLTSNSWVLAARRCPSCWDKCPLQTKVTSSQIEW